MILEEQRKKRKLKNIGRFFATIILIVCCIALIHACSVHVAKERAKDAINLGEEIKEGVKEITPSKEEAKEIAKNGISKTVDFILDSSEYINENVTKPAVEMSNELAEEKFGFSVTSPLSDEGEETASLVHVTYWDTIDGDTIKVLTENSEFVTVRLIGINAPESVADEEYLAQKDTENSEYGKMASDFTKEYLLKTVAVNAGDMWLSFDKETTDDYGRTLAYAWVSNEVDVNNKDDVINYMLNAQIVKAGYAEDVVYEPNHKYASVFKKLRKEAEDVGAGLWQYEDIKDYY